MSIERLKTADCCGCYACKTACPTQCIEMLEDGEGFWYPKIDTARCVGCDVCEKVCPALKQEKESHDLPPKAYAAINKDETVRKESSSGGIFTLLAEQILSEGGVVFGAAFSENCREVNHIPVERPEELYRLRGSKYVQSRIGETYRQVQEALNGGRKVLFTGTPCQIEGLKTFLGKDHAGLLCVDIICHGVPSPKVWKEYVKYREESAGAPVRQTFFRHKKYGWKMFSVLCEFSNETVYVENLSKDFYMQAFLKNACLRPSCHQCHYKKLNRVSDLTLADFWGIEQVMPEMDDDQGTSLLLVHTEKGEELLKCLSSAMTCKAADVKRAVEFNSAAVKSVPIHENRDVFFADLDKMPFDRLVKRYIIKMTAKERIVGLLKKMGLWNVVQTLRGR